jgi:hypothetical protein
MSSEIARRDEAPEGSVAVKVLNVKTGQLVPAYIPSELAERFPSYGNVEEMAELAAEVFGDDGGNLSVGDLVRVKVPDGNSKAFTIGDEVQKTVKGIVILRQERRNYWAQSVEEGGNQPPNCFSRDAVTGVGDFGVGSAENPTGKCDSCPMSQWSDVDGKRVPPPCHQQEAVLMLVEDMAFPLLLTVPRTSIKNFREYWKNKLYMGKMQSLPEVVTEVGLSQTKNDAQTVYNELTFTLAENITKGEQRMTREERESYKLVPLALAEHYRKILVHVDTAQDTETPASRVAGDDEGGFSIADEDIEAEYAGQSAAG